jgi:hypothetical protein
MIAERIDLKSVAYVYAWVLAVRDIATMIATTLKKLPPGRVQEAPDQSQSVQCC